MDAMSIAQQYFDAWNLRDSNAIIRSFTNNGTYTDPVSGQVQGQALANYANGLFSAFPDLSFEIVSVAPIGTHRIVGQWLMRGTNMGSFNGLPPTNKSVLLPGADFITVSEEGITSVEGYFDSRAVPEQLGLQVLVQPHSLGPFTFGTCTYLQSGKTVKPGAFSLTTMIAQSEQEKEQVREDSIRIMKEMIQMPGFISTIGLTAGNRMSTITAWEKADNTKQLMQHPAHKEGVARFFNTNFGGSAMTSVWVADHFNKFWVRCKTCGQIADYEKNGKTCTCGEMLPAIPYW